MAEFCLNILLTFNIYYMMRLAFQGNFRRQINKFLSRMLGLETNDWINFWNEHELIYT